MRLINTWSLELEEFFDNEIPPYAILSHRWQPDEVSFQDMQNGTGNLRAGFTKIELVCGEASRRRLDYVWVDTVCIDKTSSAELSEAINSMYRWYKKAEICCVFLFDVGSRSPVSDQLFCNACWWSRGWTLQELIAPSEVAFFDSSWNFLGTKESLQLEISEITGIDVKTLAGKYLERRSIAERMSWASKRSTTRLEDRAYCLLGLFGVNMPLLYGEGERAFIRLQEEIMKHSDDHSLFAWSFSGGGYRGLLAQSPAEFDCPHIMVAQDRMNRTPYSITNMGLSIEFQMKQWAMDTYFVTLDCQYDRGHGPRVGIFLRQLKENNQMARVTFDGSSLRAMALVRSAFKPKSIYVRQTVFRMSPPPVKKYGFWLRTLPTIIKIQSRSHNEEHILKTVTSWNTWNSTERFIQIPVGQHGTAGVFLYRSSEKEFSIMKLGFDSEFRPVCLLGGPAWGPSAASYVLEKNMDLPDKFILHDKWLDTGDNNWVFPGERTRGLLTEKFRTKISIQEGRMSDDPAWIVDIEQLDNDLLGRGPRHEGVQCDGCWTENMRGTRYKCRVCPDFDFCENCYSTARLNHPISHTFKTFRKPGDADEDDKTLASNASTEKTGESEDLGEIRTRFDQILSISNNRLSMVPDQESQNGPTLDSKGIQHAGNRTVEDTSFK
ncbi:HET-domain-containing protein [Mollisia scopiformis]|uniref:HET-domain-containing protein n=1 Tax=Mollisia scopiformis TaxID=149040 RepID=A0A194WXQ7_MOLSC|nr:HET-domain-containing protein [Mollisia scopiformis]KUJ12715.1 HET-domain-containing protein [Mollisia scopiformis]